MLDIILKGEDLKKVEVLKEKNPALYKALCIASLIDCGDSQESIEIVSKNIESYIKQMAEKVSLKLSPLKYPIPEEAAQIDLLSNKLAKEIMDTGDITPGDATSRLRSLINRTLEGLKFSGDNYVKTQKEQHIEECVGYYDQLMLLKEIAVLADKTVE